MHIAIVRGHEEVGIVGVHDGGEAGDHARGPAMRIHYVTCAQPKHPQAYKLLPAADLGSQLARDGQLVHAQRAVCVGHDQPLVRRERHVRDADRDVGTGIRRR